MTTQVAGLTFQVDSSQADRGNEKLDAMARQARVAETALQLLAHSSSDNQRAFASFGDSLGASVNHMAAFSSSLEGIVNTLRQTRDAIDGTASSFVAFEQARERATALSNALGTGAVAMEAFAQQASVFHMTSYETTSALQRITLAMEGQTAAGRQLREVMEQYGVTLNGLTSSNADQVLSRFVAQVRTVAPSPANSAAIQSVLGPLDPSALASIQNADLETVQQREQRLRIQASNTQSAQMVDAASQEIARRTRDQAAMVDYRGGLFTHGSIYGRGAYNLDQLSPAQMQQVYRGIGHAVDPNSRDGQLEIYRYLDAAPDDLRGAARQAPSPIFQPSDWFNYETQGTWFDRFRRGTGLEGRQANNAAQYAEDRFQRPGVLSWPGAELSYLGRGIGNWFGFDETTPLAADPRRAAPLLSSQQIRGRAQGLSEAGFGAPLTAADAMAHITSLTSGNPGADPTVLANLIAAYTDQGGMERNAGPEARSLYANALDLQRVAQQQAFLPNAAGINSANTAAWIQNQPISQQATARALLAYAQRPDIGISTTRWGGMSVGDLLAGGHAGQAGFLSDGQIAGFQTQRGTETSTAIDQSNQATRQQIDLQQQLQSLIPAGAAVMQNATTYWQTYNDEVGKVGPEQARATAVNALRVAIERRDTAMKQELNTLKETADANEHIVSLTNAAGSDPQARGVAALQASQDNQVRTATLAGQDPVAYRALLQRGSVSGALSQVSTFTTDTTKELADQRQIVQAAGQRADVQMRLNNQLEVTRQLQQQIIAVQQGGNPQQIAALRAQIDALTTMKDKIDDLQRTTQNYNEARDQNTSADVEKYISRLPPEKQRAARTAWTVIQRNLSAPSSIGGDGGAGNPLLGPLPGADGGALPGGGPGNSSTADVFSGVPIIAGAGSSDPEALRRLRQAIENPSNSSNDPSQRADIDASQNSRIAQEQSQITDAQRQTNYDIARAVAASRAAGQGSAAQRMAEAGVANPSDLDPTGSADRRKAVASAQIAQQLAGESAATTQAISDNQRLAAAYQQSTVAGDQMRQTIEAESRARELGLTSTQQDIVARGELAKAITAQAEAYQHQQAQQRDQQSVMSADINAGPFASPVAVNDARNRVTAKQLADSGVTDFQSALSDLNQNDALKQLYEDTRTARQGFQEMGDTAQSAIENAIVSGGRFHDVMRSLDQELEKILLRTLVQNPIDHILGAAVDSIMGPSGSQQAATTPLPSGVQGPVASPSDFAGKIGGFASNFALNKLFGGAASGIGGLFGSGANVAAATAALPDGVAGPVAAASDFGGAGGWFGSLASTVGSWFAQGGFIDQGKPTRYLASGGLIDRPTTIYAAGGTVMAGEVGSETILPLYRTAGGDLGVKSSGGGGGGSNVTVISPITIQGGGGGNQGAMSPQQAKVMQKQIENMHKAAVRQVLTDQMRPGGDIYSMGGQH